MQHLLPLEVTKRALRSEVCPQCIQRQPDGPWPLDQPRPCEGECTIFINLPQLLLVAREVKSPSIGPYEHAIQQLICQTCHSNPTAGDYCAGRTLRECPLSRYGGLVVDVLERLAQARRGPGPAC